MAVNKAVCAVLLIPEGYCDAQTYTVVFLSVVICLHLASLSLLPTNTPRGLQMVRLKLSRDIYLCVCQCVPTLRFIIHMLAV